MNKRNILALLFGMSLVLIMLFGDFLWRELWILSLLLDGIVAIGCFVVLLYSFLKGNWTSFSIIIASALISAVIYLPETELLKSKPVLKARLIDDLTGLNLTLREDETFELEPVTWMGTFEVFSGKYRIDGTRIIFLNRPYDNDFIPDTVDIYKNKIILNGNMDEPDTTFAQYFDIQLNLLKKPDNTRQ